MDEENRRHLQPDHHPLDLLLPVVRGVAHGHDRRALLAGEEHHPGTERAGAVVLIRLLHSYGDEEKISGHYNLTYSCAYNCR